MSDSLTGARVWVTRPVQDAENLTERLLREGAQVLCEPLISILPLLDEELGPPPFLSLSDYDWILITSINGARHFLSRVAPSGTGDPQVAALGARSADAVAEAGWPVAFQSTGAGGAVLGRDLVTQGVVGGRSFLHPCSSIAATELSEVLKTGGAAKVTLWPVYRNAIPLSFDKRVIDLASVAVFYSPSAVKNLFVLHGNDLPFEKMIPVAVGETTADALRTHGVTTLVVAQTPSVQSVMDAITNAFRLFLKGS